MPSQQHPADVQQNDDQDQPDAERDEEGDGSAAASDDHGSRVPEPCSEVRIQKSEFRMRWLRGFSFWDRGVYFGDTDGFGDA